MDRGRDVLDGAGRLDNQRDCNPGPRQDEDLHTTAQEQVVIQERAAALQLLASDAQALLIRRDTVRIVERGRDVVDVGGRLDIQCDWNLGPRLHVDLHATAQERVVNR